MGADLTGVVRRESRRRPTAECVEAGSDRPVDGSPEREPAAGARDTKDPEGPKPYFTPVEWDAFRRGIQTGDFMVRTN